ncbi:hypothetical protein QTP88_003070 [Uroleucon formosanum]
MDDETVIGGELERGITAKECFGFNIIMIKPKSKHTIRHILELPSSLPPSKRPAAKPPDAPWTKRRKLILPPVNKQRTKFIVFVKKQEILSLSIMAERINFDNLLFALVGVGLALKPFLRGLVAVMLRTHSACGHQNADYTGNPYSCTVLWRETFIKSSTPRNRSFQGHPPQESRLYNDEVYGIFVTGCKRLTWHSPFGLAVV